MNELLEARIVELLAALPDQGVEEIARALRARTQDVRVALTSDAFVELSRGAHPGDRAKVYRIAPTTADGLGRAGRRSQCDLIASVLGDGRWHTVAEIHRRCGFSRLNSRVAELRSRRGMTIECRHVAGSGRGAEAYEYRAVTSEGDDGDRVRTHASSSPSGVSASAALSPEPADPPAETPELPEAA